MIHRIILIGNGFDRAHQMKTTYTQFIDSYWEETLKSFWTSKNNNYSCNEFSVRKLSSQYPVT
ncbi:AbiH family protein, partial [Chryseobacterium nematophagum]